MKKIFYLMSVCALAFISCQKEEMADNAQSGKFNYTFTANHVLDTKATVSDKTDNKWPVLWEKGDQLGVYLADGTFVGIANLTDESAGKNSGTFTLSTETEIADGTALKFSYPYVENAVSGTGVVAAEQTLASAASAGVGANAVAFAEAVYVQGQTNVILNHVNAYLKFNIASAEGDFAGYNLDGITLWADDAAVSGNIDGNAYSNTGDYVKVSLTSPVTVGTQAQPLWLTSLPADLSECKKVYAIVHMSKGTETVTLPVRLNGAGSLPAGSVTEITLPSLTKSLAPAWYEPVETRYIAAYGEGWCYGPENTVLFKAKNTAQTVELKARGNFMKVVEPAYVQVLFASNQSQDKTTGFVKFDGTDSHNGTSFIEHEIGNDYSVSFAIGNVNNSTANGQISAVLVKDSNKNTIWGINLWACFNALKTVTYDNGTILTYDLGAGNTIDAYNDWKSQGCYFQWGRPWAFPYSDNAKFGWTKLPTSNAVTLAKSASTPWAMYNYNGEPYDWYWGDGNKTDRSGDLDDLWGNPTSSGVGVKSIYDPCPKGYRVADPAILNEIESGINASIDETTAAITSVEGAATEIVTSTSLYYLKHKGVAWSFAGAHQNASGSNSRIENKVDAAVYWSNAISGNQARAMWVRKKKANNKYSIERLTGRSRALAAQVRCMVDTENR